ncbi:MAG: hypothetical protein ACKO0Z_18165, partial [Betaproteobacteria bacterium]
GATGGTFTLTSISAHSENLDNLAVTSGPIPYDATAEEIKAILDESVFEQSEYHGAFRRGVMPNVIGGPLPGMPITVIFHPLDGDMALMTADTTNLIFTGGADVDADVQTDTAGAAGDPGTADTPGTNEEQRVTLDQVSGGTFSLDLDGTPIGPIDWDADATSVESAFADASITVDATGPSGGPWLIEFTAERGEQDVPELTGDATDLIGTAGSTDVWHDESTDDATLGGIVDGSNRVFSLSRPMSSRCRPMVTINGIQVRRALVSIVGIQLTLDASITPQVDEEVRVIYFD